MSGRLCERRVCCVAGGAAGQLAPGVVFTEQPADVVVVRGGRALLHCATSGTADVVVTWLHDGVPIVTDGQRRRVLVDGTLVLQQVSARRQAGRRPDVGAYRCRATAPAGTILSRLATVSIAGTSRLERHHVGPLDWVFVGIAEFSNSPVIVFCCGYLMLKIVEKKNVNITTSFFNVSHNVNDNGHTQCLAKLLHLTSDNFSQLFNLHVRILHLICDCVQTH